VLAGAVEQVDELARTPQVQAAVIGGALREPPHRRLAVETGWSSLIQRSSDVSIG
jgi:hypothetical protein